ncbi:MAG: hypothetical protein M0Z47_01945 [Actinomycetota bacterium]|nr:hypothetical protein [Actinomycetota bacterium]
MAIPHSSDPELPEPDLAEMAARAAQDPPLLEFVEETKRAVADGSIWDQVAEQPDLRELLKEYGY